MTSPKTRAVLSDLVLRNENPIASSSSLRTNHEAFV
jgi:hypothetical protein